jgi:predicted ABC-class ATPase
MMTEEHIKEAISKKYIELIASRNGYSTSTPELDYGTDLSIIEVGLREDVNNKSRYSETGRELKFQLKATTENSIIISDEHLKYDLEAKNYNDLIMRRNTKSPLILVLFILPTNQTEWLIVSENELIAKKCAYWYIPQQNEGTTDNADTKRIVINKNNLINSDTLNQLFEEYA